MIQSKIPGRLLVAFGAAIAALAFLAPAASAQEPAPGFERFAGCPSPEENPAAVFCIRSEVFDGHLQTGSKDVPIENPLTIVGGLNEELGGFSANSKGGLSKTKQKVPGGVIGLTGLTWLLEFFGSDALTLYATAEFAGTPGNFSPSSITLPLKVHLETPSGVLGNNCYIGSTSSPITLNLITGTTNPPSPNEPITGREPEFSETSQFLFFKNGKFVDNSFSVPGASGCVLKLFGFIPISLNGFVNSQSNLPSAAGNNEAIQEYDLEITEQALVYP